jgi:hypothetical protein
MFLRSSVVPPSIVLPRETKQLVAPEVGLRKRRQPQRLAGELHQALVRLRPHPLRQRSLRARLAVLLDAGEHAVGGQAQDLGADMELSQLGLDQRVAELI